MPYAEASKQLSHGHGEKKIFGIANFGLRQPSASQVREVCLSTPQFCKAPTVRCGAESGNKDAPVHCGRLSSDLPNCIFSFQHQHFDPSRARDVRLWNRGVDETDGTSEGC